VSPATSPAGSLPAGSSRLRRRIRNPRRLLKLYLFVLPAAALLFLFHYVPIYGIVISFKEYSPYLGVFGSPWVGLKHFRSFLADPKFWNVIKNTLLISALDIGFGFPAPIVFALLANEIAGRRFKRVMQTVSYLPHFVSWVVVFGIFYQFLSPVYGIAMRFVAMLGVEPPNILGRVSLFRPLVVSLEIWKGVGWGAILYFATLAGIDEGLYEAAHIDGAGRVRMVFSITIPGILPIVMLLLIFRIAGFFSVGFERIFVFSNPLNYEVSDVLGVYVYRLGLIQAQYSRTAAIGLTQSVLAFTLLFTANRLSGRIAGLALW
jgi:putative aldouronate transport system permease protein